MLPLYDNSAQSCIVLATTPLMVWRGSDSTAGLPSGASEGNLSC